MPPSKAVIARYKRQISLYRDRASRLLVAAWDELGSWDKDDIEAFALRTAPGLTGAQTAAVALSSAFFAMSLGIRPVAVSAADIEVTANIEGPFHATWHALAMGRAFEEAIGVGRSTASATAFDFVQSSARRTGDVVAERSGRTVRWRRVPGGTSCPWCVDKAQFTYTSSAAADFGHQRCDCDAVPA